MLKGLKTGFIGKSKSKGVGGVKFLARQNDSKVRYTEVGSPTTHARFKYSINGSSWNDYTLNYVIDLPNANDYVLFKATDINQELFTSNNDYGHFNLSGGIQLEGNIQYLLDNSGEQLSCPNNAFRKTFNDEKRLLDISNLEFPALSLGNDAYHDMFIGCANLTAAPAVLPATTFNGQYAYWAMFYLTGIKDSPDILAPVINQSGTIRQMFLEATQLSSIQVHFTTWPSDSWFWVYRVSGQGKFYCPHTLQDKRGNDNIPTAWKIIYNDIEKSYDASTFMTELSSTITDVDPAITKVNNNINEPLTRNVDYTVAFSGLELPGTGTATFTGIGDYHGTKTATFQVKARTLATITSPADTLETGSPQTPGVTIKNLIGLTLTLNVDYTLSYSDNTLPGQATVIATGIGTYSGTLSAHWTIHAKDLDIAYLSAISFRYDGTAKTPPPTVKNWAGTTLTEGTDYTLSYSNNTDEGYRTASCLITGIGSYAGKSKTLTFSIDDYLSEGFCFKCLSAGSIVRMEKQGTVADINLVYKTSEDGEWQTFELNTDYVMQNVGDMFTIRSNGSTTFSEYSFRWHQFKNKGKMDVFGKIGWLIDPTGLKMSGFSRYMFHDIFNSTSDENVLRRAVYEVPLTDPSGYNSLRGMLQSLKSMIECPVLGTNPSANDSLVYIFQSAGAKFAEDTLPANAINPYVILDLKNATFTGSFNYSFRATGGTFTGNPTKGHVYYCYQTP